MSEDGFVRMLLEAAGGEVTDERDLQLARNAAHWALNHGWQPSPYGDDQGFICNRGGLQFWVDDTSSRDALMVMVRLDSSADWRTHGRYPIAHLGHALDVLTAEGLLPAWFSTISRSALEGHAEVLWRAAKRVLAQDESLADWACGLAEAAESAKRYARAELAVTG